MEDGAVGVLVGSLGFIDDLGRCIRASLEHGGWMAEDVDFGGLVEE